MKTIASIVSIIALMALPLIMSATVVEAVAMPSVCEDNPNNLPANVNPFCSAATYEFYMDGVLLATGQIGPAGVVPLPSGPGLAGLDYVIVYTCNRSGDVQRRSGVL